MHTGFWRRLCFTALLCCTTLAYAAPSASPEGLPIQSINIEVVGEDQKSHEALSSTLQTREKERISQSDFDQDLKFVSKEFDRVEPAVTVDNGEVKIVLRLWKKPLIHTITWIGNSAIPSDKLQKEFGIASNSVFDRDGFSKAIQKLRLYYVKKGFFESDVDYKIIRGDQSNIIDIEITINEGRAGYIESIEFLNFTPKEADELAEQLLTKEYCFYLSWLNNQGTFYKDVFRQDEIAALRYLQNEGYLDAKITTNIRPSEANKDRIIISISASKGEVYHLGNITAEGSVLYTPEVVVQKSELTKGSVYSPDGLAMAVHRIKNLFGAKGYIDASIVPTNKLDEATRTYDVHLTIDEGKCYRVGMIDIVGNTRTDSSVILHETLLEPGSIFDSTLLEKTEERLRNIGYFKSVNVYAVKSSKVQSDDASFRDVRIEVEEIETTARFTAFAGWNSTQGISGGVMLFESNFKIAGIPKLFSDGLKAVRGGGENAKASVTVGTKQVSYDLSWTKPYFLDTPWILGVDLQEQRNSYSATDYTLNTSLARISGRYPINPFLQGGIHYRIQYSKVHLKGVSHSSRNRELIRESKNDGTISAVGAAMYYDSTNHPVLPKKGARSTLEGEYAGIGGDHHFFVLGYLNSMYFSPDDVGVLKLRADVQAIQTVLGTKPSSLPLDERLYLGGENTMRGYRFNMVGPHFGDTHHTPRGGMSSLLFSGEYERPIYKKFNGFLFSDAGNVWWKEFHYGNLKYTAGFGFRFYISDTTPITFGYGFPLTHSSKKDVQRFFFSIGVGF